MEELLNKLIEKGWKPFGVKGISEFFFEKVPVGMYRLCWKKPDYDYNVYSKRELTSKESGLWQFICENREYGYTIPECWIKNPKICNEGIESVEKECNQNSYEYYIIESALCDEDKIEDFILDNIKL